MTEVRNDLDNTDNDTRHVVWTLEKVGDKYVAQDAVFQTEADSTTGRSP